MNRTIEANFFPEVAEPLKKPCISIIDNNRDFTYSAKRGLETTGRYFVSEENDASKAHQTAQNLRPDLILLDIAMPETDGGEVAARIQSDPALSNGSCDEGRRKAGPADPRTPIFVQADQPP